MFTFFQTMNGQYESEGRKRMVKIMFVCHGNICRSPMAEIIFNDMIHKYNLNAECKSSATSSEEIWNGIGNPIYPPAKEILIKNGYTVPNKRAELLLKSDYDKYDLFIVMDENNIRNLKRIFNGDPDNKIRKLMDYTSNPGDVSDPWYTRNFDIAFDDIYNGCSALAKIIRKKEL